jgi:hypothetical protein
VQTQTEEAPKTKEKREVSPAVPNRLQLAEHALQFHVYTAESGDYPEDFLKPEYWSLVATKFQPYDHIEVRADDGTYWAEFLVVSCDRTWARVHKLRDARLQVANEQPVDPDYKVEWKGPHKKWCVIRQGDKSIVHDGEAEKSFAVRWLEEYVRTIGKHSQK